MDFGEEISTAREGFQIKELVFFETMNGFDIALEGVGSGRDADMLAVAEGFGKVALEFTAVVGLPDQIAERDAVAIQVLLDVRSENGALAAALRFWAKDQNNRPLRTSRAVYWTMGKWRRWACSQ